MSLLKVSEWSGWPITSWGCASTIFQLCPRLARRRTLAYAPVGRNGDGRSSGLGAASRIAARDSSISVALDWFGATPAGGVMDARGGNAGCGRGAVECFLVRTAVVLDHAGNPRGSLGADRP